jgi:glucosylglycerate synthase
LERWTGNSEDGAIGGFGIGKGRTVSSSGETFSDGSLLSDEFVRALVAVGEVDLLVGITTLNDAKTVGHVVQAVSAGFAKYFSRERVVLVNVDGGSQDGTEEIIKTTALVDTRRLLAAQSLRTTHRVITHYRGAPDSALALHTIVAAADLLRAKACAVVSAELTSINPAWVDNLLRPVYREQFDLVTPLYYRHKYDGLLVSHILYPLVRAAYGKRVTEPLATEFSFSGRLASHLLEQVFWREAEGSLSPEIWITALALGGDFRVGQSFLGPKVHNERSSRHDLVGTIRLAVGTLFRCLEAQEPMWISKTDSEPLPTFGFPYEVTLEPVRFNRKRLLQMFRTGVTELASILEVILAKDTFRQVQEVGKLSDDEFHYSNELWVKTLYDFAGAYHRSIMSRDHIVQSLAPLYRGRIGSFVLQNHEATHQEIEKGTEELCQEFERHKPYLIDRWNGK